MLNLSDIIIDPEFRDLLPSLADRSRLAAKIELEGWTDEPITVWLNHGILLDGHNRYAIWQERGDDGPQIVERAFASREAAFHWVVNNQCARRNLTPEEQRYLLGRKYTAEKKCPGGDRKSEEARGESSRKNYDVIPSRSDGSVRTAERIAKEAGVSDKTVTDAEKFADAVDALDAKGIVPKSDILSGKVKVPASKVVEAAKAESPDAAKAIIQKRRPVKETPHAEPYTPDTDRKKAVANKNYTRLCTLFGQVQGIADSIEIINVDAAMALLKRDDADAWIEAVGRTTKSLRTLSERLKQEVARVTASEAEV